MMKMKKIISLICILSMLLVVLPSVNVSAAPTVNVWRGWSLSGDAVVENGILKMGTRTGASATVTQVYDMSDSFTVKFTARIVNDASNYGLMILTGEYRGGMYMGPSIPSARAVRVSVFPQDMTGMIIALRLTEMKVWASTMLTEVWFPQCL